MCFNFSTICWIAQFLRKGCQSISSVKKHRWNIDRSAERIPLASVSDDQNRGQRQQLRHVVMRWRSYQRTLDFDCCQVPWQVNRLRKFKFIQCHCIYKDDLDFRATKVGVFLGAHNMLVKSNETNRVKGYITGDFVFHPDWKSGSLVADLALVKLPFSLSFSSALTWKQQMICLSYLSLLHLTTPGFIRPICLPDVDDPDHVDDTVVHTGWATNGAISMGSLYALY